MALTKKEAAELTIEDFLNTLCKHLPGFHEVWCCNEDTSMRARAFEELVRDMLSSYEVYWQNVNS